MIGSVRQLVGKLGHTLGRRGSSSRSTGDSKHSRAGHADLPNFVELPRRMLGAVDVVFSLGEHGVVIVGWLHFPCGTPSAIDLVDPSGGSWSLSNRLYRLGRDDVEEAYRAKLPRISRRAGFIAHAPIVAATGSPLILVVRFEDGEEIRLNARVNRHVEYLDDVKDLLGAIPQPRREFFQLWNLLDSGIGAAIEKTLDKGSPGGDAAVALRAFGVQVADPALTLIVPLYGRADFMRHQLARFADDPDFGRVELLYVVDDPDLLPEVLGLAAKYEWLFGVGFRVLDYGENRGFAGANNLGVLHARAPVVLLMNSDVIPMAPGWVGILLGALASLPDAGAVGPLLEFGDGTVQHAGMFPVEDPLLPGFLLNTHIGMGQVWEGGDAPRDCPMLTAACLMLRRDVYLELGGLDEGYLVGDFEDSDLCMALRKQGKRLYLVPQARLWHLERLSQGMGQSADVRQLLTLYNGWRFRNRIRHGVIADPLAVVAAVGGEG